MTTGDDEKVVVDFTKGVTAKDLALFKAEMLAVAPYVKSIRQAQLELWVQRARAAGVPIKVVYGAIADKLGITDGAVKAYFKRLRRRQEK